VQLTPVITFRGIHASETLEADIRKRLAKLERLCARMTSARVWVEIVGRHHRRGNRVRVRVELLVPGGEVVVRHDLQASGRAGARSGGTERIRKSDEIDTGHRHARVAIREAFEAARRRLQDHLKRQRLDVKTHAPRPPATRAMATRGVARRAPAPGRSARSPE
jgi:hypothetical protein